MNTQKVIYEKLAKQNFGAIEDAINDAKDLLINNTIILENTTSELYNYTQEIFDSIMALQYELGNSLQEYSTKFDDADEKYSEVANELDSLGIKYDNPLSQIRSDFESYYENARRISEITIS